MKKLNILVLCHDVVGKSMAGPGIRYKYIAKILQRKFQTKLAVFSQIANTSDDTATINPETQDYKLHFDKTDVIFAQWLSNDMINYARSKGKILIFDLYAPVPIEYLAALEFSDKPFSKQQAGEFSAILDMYLNYLSVGQLFTCSNERQRDFWTGFMTAGRLIGPATFKKTNLLDTFVLCPMGVDKSLPKPKNLLLRSSIKNLREDDFVLIWTGGIWDWFDAQTIIRAMALIKDPSVKLVFLGTKHPNSIYTDETLETKEARLLATKLGLVDKTVFFLDGWIPYEQRGAYFMDADTAIYADKKSLETRFSHRTRVLDHFWASLPTICSQGDYMSEIIRQNDLGIVVENRDPHEFANAIFKLKTDKKLYAGIRQNLKKHREDFTWEKTLEPLVRYLDTVDAPAVRQQIIDSYRKTDQNRKLSMKRRIRHSARILLLGR